MRYPALSPKKSFTEIPCPQIFPLPTCFYIQSESRISTYFEIPNRCSISQLILVSDIDHVLEPWLRLQFNIFPRRNLQFTTTQTLGRSGSMCTSLTVSLLQLHT